MAQVQVPPQAQAVNAGGNQFVTTSLYVGDLELNVTDSQLYDVFNSLGQVVSVRVCRDLTTRRSLSYGYVNYANPQDAARALEMLNFTPVNGKPIRIMYSHRDPSVRKSGAGNIFIKNLDKAIDHKALHDTFSSFGNILSCKVATDSSGQSKGYGFVQYDSDEAAQKAIEKLNGMLLNDKQVYVGPFLRKQERDMASDKAKFTNVFVKNLSESTTEEDLKNIFGQFGPITSAVVMRDADGTSRCFGFVNFESADDAAQSVESLNGQTFDNKEWYVGKAQKKTERELELKVRFEQSVKEAADKSQGLNLYIKNLDDSIGDDNLKEMFSPFGTIASYKVMRDPHGISKGSGFVAFSTPEEATRALLEMNGKMVVSKPLYVAHAQRKEDRRVRLQAQFSQMRPVAMAPSVAPRMPMYPPGGPGLGQQIFYGQAPPAIMPPQPGFGYQQQLLPGMRPGGAPMPNFFVPMVQQGQQGQRPGGRRGGAVPVQQGQQPLPLMQQQMLPRGRVFRYPTGRGLPDVSMQGVGGGMLSVPYDIGGGMPFRDGGMSQPIPIGALASALANASLSDQRTMLGENLYPLVEQLEPEYAAKVTGMLLEMDQTEVLHLLESPEALKAKVAEAMEVLRNVQQQQAGNPADQLAALSLNDGLVS
ncbi:polyadenylate-binding protein 8-like [Rhododendron vialii]|uniref:polyadenylate-binding protein 8-like n=1 Tax=Rhododendron vialii TaxID=182163 RepID=UPI0026603348|nr:polyadenylate-binding protein 8-like [Rhododendron vialii]